MDEKYLEFWGNLLLNAARSKKQVNDIFSWIQKGFPDLSEKDKQGVPDFKELSEMFHKLYGLDKLSIQSEEYKEMSIKAFQDFQKSFKEHLESMGIISRDEHLALIKKYEALKAKCADQEETIKHLRMLLDSKKSGEADISSQFQDIVKDQGELFQKMMFDFSQYFSTSDANSDKEEKNKGRKQDND